MEDAEGLDPKELPDILDVADEQEERRAMKDGLICVSDLRNSRYCGEVASMFVYPGDNESVS